MTQEYTSQEVAALASRALRGDPMRADEIKTLAASCLAQAQDTKPWADGDARRNGSKAVQGLPVSGYKATQPPGAIAAVNVFKELEERTLRQIDVLMETGDNERDFTVDGRSLAIGRTQLQGAFMFLARAIFQPGRVKLPEDDVADAPLRWQGRTLIFCDEKK